MTTTYTTNVISMSTLPQMEGQTDVVVNADYYVTGTDGTHTASIGVSQQFTLSPNFTPYAQLTEAQVVGWISPEDLENAKTCVDGQIASMVNPPISPSSKALPW